MLKQKQTFKGLLYLAVFLFVGFSFVACEKNNDEPVALEQQTPEATASVQSASLTKQGFSDCSYPGKGTPITQAERKYRCVGCPAKLEAGKKYFIKFSLPIYVNGTVSFQLHSGGPIVTRSVYEKNPWFGRTTYQVNHWCERMTMPGIRVFSGSYSDLDSKNWDNIYYEVIAEGEAKVSWTVFWCRGI